MVRGMGQLWRASALVGIPLLFACGGSGSQDPRSLPWTLVRENPAYTAYQANWEAGLAVPELAPERFLDADLAAARGTPFPAPPPPPQVGGFCVFPSSYDLRALGRSTPAWEPPACACGSCWTHATTGALESSMASWGPMRNLSEHHLQLNWLPFQAACGQGGHGINAVPYLAAWRGPVDHADFDACGSRSLPFGASSVRAHVQQVLRLPDRTGPLDNCWIKWALVHLGALYTSCAYSGWTPSLSDDNAHYDPKPGGEIHAVTIVGWDDDFDRHRFLCVRPDLTPQERIPAGDGAFLVKDNKGPTAHDQGHFWISYYDGSMTSQLAFVAEPTTNYARNYQHDPVGGHVDYLTLPAYDPATGEHFTSSWQGNVFEAEAEEYLVAVGFFELEDAEMDYQVRVYLDPTKGPVHAGPPDAVVDVPLLLPGYFTARLPEQLHLHAGQRFGVVLRGTHRANPWPPAIPLERPGPGDTHVRAKPGQGFLSANGSTWNDLTTVVPLGASAPLLDTSLRIKAFTAPILTAKASLQGDRRLAWELANDGVEGAWLRPRARARLPVGGFFEEVGEEVGADHAVDEFGVPTEVFEGWAFVPPGQRITVFSAGSPFDLGVQVMSWVGVLESVAVFEGLNEYLNDLLPDPLHVVATNPVPGGEGPHGLNVITVTLDAPAQAGPGLSGITVSTPTQQKPCFPSVLGNLLVIHLGSPITSVDGSTVWGVHLPADAVLSAAGGQPLAGPYDWSFTVLGLGGGFK